MGIENNLQTSCSSSSSSSASPNSEDGNLILQDKIYTEQRSFSNGQPQPLSYEASYRGWAQNLEHPQNTASSQEGHLALNDKKFSALANTGSATIVTKGNSSHRTSPLPGYKSAPLAKMSLTFMKKTP
jgi:hypothetical protein